MKLAIPLAALVLVAATACEKPSHENIDKWRGTVKGPDKLQKALNNEDLDPDLRAHAAQALIALDQFDNVKAAVDGMQGGTKMAVLAKLVPRLWDDCKLAEELQVPASKQLYAKDAMFALRAGAPPEVVEQIDGYLVDWYGGYYEGRASMGKYNGELVIRTIGKKAAPKLLAAVKTTAGEKAEGGKLVVVGDTLLLGLAYTGAPEAVQFLLKLADKPQGIDDTLPSPERLQVRAMGALRRVFVENTEPPRVPGSLLKPHLGLLQAIAASDDQPGENVNVSYELIAAAGMPECLVPLKVLASVPEEVRRWRAVQVGLKCGGVQAAQELSDALPEDADYPKGVFEKYWIEKIIETGQDPIAAAKAMLGSKSWVTRTTGVLLLQAMGKKGDADAVKALAGDGAKVKGWWGKDGEGGTAAKPGTKPKKKPDPTVGDLARAAADKLAKK